MIISSKDVETVLRVTFEGEGYEISKVRGHVVTHPGVDGPWLHLQQFRDFLQC